MGFLRFIISPFVTVFQIAGSAWNHTGDWGWHISIRILATLVAFGCVLFFFLWAWSGFQNPFRESENRRCLKLITFMPRLTAKKS